MGTYVRLRIIGLASLMLFLFSCTENAEIFTSLNDTETPSLETVSTGTVVAPDETLSIQLAYPDEDMSRVTSLVAELRNPEGGVVGSVSFSADQLLEQELPPIELPKPSPGPYILFVEAQLGTEILFTEERQIFVTDTVPVIESVAVFPSAVGTDTTAVALAEIEYTDGVRPYLQWIYNDLWIGGGYIDGGFDRIAFDPGDEEGVHPIRVELFPWGPDEGVDVSQETTIFATTDVFVRDQVPQPADDEAILLRYRFQGRDLPDTDRLVDEYRPIDYDDAVSLDVRDDHFGYALETDQRITAPYNTIPPVGETYRIEIAASGIDPTDGTVLAFSIEEPGTLVATIQNERIASPESGVGQGSKDRGIAGSVSALLINTTDGLYIVPEPVDGGVAVSQLETVGDPARIENLAVQYRGAVPTVVEQITITQVDGVNELFRPGMKRFLPMTEESETEGEIAVFSVTQLVETDITLVVPESGVTLWTDTVDASTFILWWQDGIVSLAELPEETEAAATDLARVLTVDSIDSDGYTVIGSTEIQNDTIRVTGGLDASITTEGIVVFPEGDDRGWSIVTSTTPIAIGTESP